MFYDIINTVKYIGRRRKNMEIIESALIKNTTQKQRKYMMENALAIRQYRKCAFA
jgi:hypothetical protein